MSNPKSTRHNENQILNMFGELGGDREKERWKQREKEIDLFKGTY